MKEAPSSPLLHTFDKALTALKTKEKVIYRYCSQEKVFRDYVTLYLQEARGYIPFSRVLQSEQNHSTVIDVIGQLFGFNIQVYSPITDESDELVQLTGFGDDGREVIPVFHDGHNHFEWLSFCGMVEEKSQSVLVNNTVLARTQEVQTFKPQGGNNMEDATGVREGVLMEDEEASKKGGTKRRFSDGGESEESARGKRNKVEEEKAQAFAGRRFAQFLKEGYVWSRLREFAEKVAQEEGVLAEDVMKELVEYRDFLDGELYQQSAQALFPKERSFTIIVEPWDFISGGKSIFKYYTLKIYNQLDKAYNRPRLDQGDPDAPPADHCEIRIQASGSRNLTSDIDTTVSVRGVENLASALSRSPLLSPEELQTHDHTLLIQAKMIEQFHQLNMQRDDCGNMTAATSRDSNVYSDGFLRKQPVAYAKFHENPTVSGKPFLGDERGVGRVNFYANFKRDKHQLEMAASLVSLCDALAPGEWGKFKETVLARIDDFGIEGEENLTAIRADFLAICLKVEDLCKHEYRELKEESRNFEYHEDPLEKEHEIVVRNTLYTKHLKEVAKIEFKLSQLPPQIDAATQKLEKVKKQLKILEINIAHYKTSPICQKESELYDEEEMKKELSGFEQKEATLKENHEKAKHNLEQILKKQAELQIDRQSAQIHANLFAYEAYVNRSASYHVVEGMQSGQGIQLSKQTVMASTLQQVGFKLQHAQHMQAEGVSPEEIAYKTAKYGQRVAHLFFGQKDIGYDDKVLRQIPKGGYAHTIKILGAFESQNRFEGYFTFEELALLNRDLHIIGKVKSNKAIPELDKPTAVLKLALGQADEQAERERWLSIGAKIFVAGYKARLEKRKGLWGALQAEHLSNCPKVEAALSPVNEAKSEALPHHGQAGLFPSMFGGKGALQSQAVSGSSATANNAQARNGGVVDPQARSETGHAHASAVGAVADGSGSRVTPTAIVGNNSSVVIPNQGGNPRPF